MSEGRQPGEPFPGLEILASVESGDWPLWLGGDPEEIARTAMHAAAIRAGLPSGIESELGLTLTDDETIGGLNRQWRGKDGATNVLSFPMAPLEIGEAPGPMMGDLVLALETCAREATAEAKAPRDHFAHLIVHGFLHLLGHDHLDEDEAGRMEALEILVLADLGIADPYGAAGAEHAAPMLEEK